MSRRSSASVFGGKGAPSGVRSVARRSGALRNVGLKFRMPRRARAPFIRFTMRVRSPTRFSRSRFGRLASSSSMRRDRDHAAVVPFAAQPAEKCSLQQFGVEPVRLRPPMLARHGHARRVNDVGFDAARPQPARQPEAVAASLEGNGDTRDRAAGLDRLVLPALQQSEQRLRVRLELLHRVALDPGNDAGDQPARLAHLDDRDQRAIRFQSREGSAQVIGLRHGTLHRLFPATMVPCPRRSPHSIFNRRRARRITHGAERLLGIAMTTPPRPFRKIVGRPRPQGKTRLAVAA